MTDVYVHPTAVVDTGARIGAGTKIWHFAHVSAGAAIGEACVLGQNVFVADGVWVGSRVRIQNNVSLYTGVSIDDDVFLGPSAVFTNVVNPRSFVSRKHEYRPTRVGRGATVGANATIICGHAIGEYAFIGAGAVVTKDVLPYSLVFGNPARRAGWMCRCGTRLSLGSVVQCHSCGESFRIVDGQCVPEAAR